MTEEIRIELQGQFGYQCVRIQQAQGLGVGSYGSVCRATLDELPCAAKLLHATFFGTHNSGAANFTARFEQECRFLSSLKHPCIVQFLGLVREPRTLRPILLMELMDESLTKFLERTTGPLPYHVQVNLIHDTALALAYLHSNRIIHRDLSSNNILLLAGCRAKVTDFGMSRMVDVNPCMTPLTQCPGTPAFMAPEALLAEPVYSDKLDVFSAGVLAIQVMTHRFPMPTKSKRKMEHPASPTGYMEVPVPETERRKDDLDQIASTHPLLPIAIWCIKDTEKERPSAAQLCQSLAALKEALAYAETVQERPEGTASLQQMKTSLEKERENRDLRQQLVQNEEVLQETTQQLAEKENNTRTTEQAIRAKNQEIKGNEQEINTRDQAGRARDQEIRGKNQQLEGKEREIADLRREVADMQQLLAQFQTDLRERERENKELPQRVQAKQPPTPAATPSKTYSEATSKPTQQQLKLQCQTQRKAPERMVRGAAVTHHNTIYCISADPNSSHAVYQYHVDNDEWKKHSDSPYFDTGLAIIRDLLTVVGGQNTSGKTNKLLSWRRRRWKEVFPPMNTARSDHAVVSSESYVIAAGGRGDKTSVELFSVSTKTWCMVSSLPEPLSLITATISLETLYVMGYNGRVYSTSLSCLTRDASRELAQPIWQPLPNDAPFLGSTLSTLSGEVVVVGGLRDGTTTGDLYQLYRGEWVRIGCMDTARFWPIVAVLPEDRMVVVGSGWPYYPSSSLSSPTPKAVELAVLC